LNKDYILKLVSLNSLIITLLLAGCSDSSERSEAPEPIPDNPFVVNFNFADAASNWEVGFSDYPVDDNDIYDLQYAYMQLPAPLQDRNGLFVSGANYSDDLFMFVTKQFTGLQKNSRYEVIFEVSIATSEPTGCFGIGGAQGESVYVKAGATAFKPVVEDLGTGNFSMNLDKGNQAISGSNAIVLGDLANGLPCTPPGQYVIKSLTSEGQKFELVTNTSGNVWLMLGTDSGFEGTTAIYYVSGKLTATLIN